MTSRAQPKPKTQYVDRAPYRLQAVVMNDDGSRFEVGEEFMFQVGSGPNGEDCFVALFDDALISLAVARKFERKAKMPLFERI